MMLELAWAAGLFEGEGTVTIIGQGKKRRYTRPIVTLSSTDSEIVDFFQKRWPGNLRWYLPKKSLNAKPAISWTLQNRTAIKRFLNDIRPYIQTARVWQKIELLFEDINARVQGSRSDPLYIERCQSRRTRMMNLNLRGRGNMDGTVALLKAKANYKTGKPMPLMLGSAAEEAP